MIVVKVELWPGGDESRSESLGEAKIWNESNLADISDYGYLLKTEETPYQDGLLTCGDIKQHNRFQSVWSLVGKTIQSALKSREREIAKYIEDNAS
jgi:hypothetical protein